MDFFTLLHSTAAAFRGVDKLAGQAERHRFFTSALGSFTQPAHGQSHTADRSNFDRNLVVGTADTAGLNFNQRTNIVQSVCEHFEGIFTRLVLDFFQSAIHDAFSNGFLAVKHDHVDEFGDLDGTEFRIRENFTFRYFATTGHVYLSFVFSQINWECISIMKMRLTRS